jgi:hypothetical protein
VTGEPTPVRRIAGALRTPGDLRPRRPLGDGARAARSFAFDLARPLAARTGPLDAAQVAIVAALPDGVLPSGRGTAVEGPALPQTGALAAYAALLARKARPPRDVPVRGLPLTVRRRAHAEGLRGPGSLLESLRPVDATVPPNAARAPRPRAARPSQPSPMPSPQPSAQPPSAGAAQRPRPVARNSAPPARTTPSAAPAPRGMPGASR